MHFTFFFVYIPSMENEKKIALIIDCDNAKAEAIYGIMEELSKLGDASIRRAYGNWKGNNPWEEFLHPFAIQPIQQFAYTKGKNATDLAMTIDAMDILYTENVDIFAIVSSDSDFTPLAMKLKAKGKQVIGFGEEKTPQPFIDSCKPFFFIDNFKKPTKEDDSSNTTKPWDKNQLKGRAEIMKAIRTAIDESKDESGWAQASKVSMQVNNLISLSPKNFGYAKWASLIHATEYFEEQKNSKGQLEFKIKGKG